LPRDAGIILTNETNAKVTPPDNHEIAGVVF